MNPQIQYEDPQETLTRTVDMLASRHKEVREGAEKDLQAMGPEAIDQLLAILSTEANKRKSRRKWIIGGAVTYFLLILLIGIRTQNFGMLGQIGSVSGMLAAAYASKKQKSVTKYLALTQDKRAVGPLAEALEYRDRDLTAIVGPCLVDLLGKLQASDAGLLNAEQRGCLCRALNGKDLVLALSVLKAFEQIGDSAALPAVEKLASSQRRGARNLLLQDKARECLVFLRPRAENEIAMRQLLRASDGDVVTADILLRPSQEHVESRPQELLRASTAEQQATAHVQLTTSTWQHTVTPEQPLTQVQQLFLDN